MLHRLLLPALLLTAACGPSLRQARHFGPGDIKRMRFDDDCDLQAYFDRDPPPLRAESERGIREKGGKLTSGVATYRIAGPARAVFVRLLRHFYRRLPPLDRARELRVTVSYYARGQGKRLPIGGRIVLDLDGDEVELPYHPCVGEFLYGRPFYDIRRKLMSAVSRALIVRPVAAAFYQPRR